MAESLLERLRKKDKKGFFKRSQSSVMYRTGFLPLDFRNGYIMKSVDINENVLSEYAATGITGGTFITIVGKTGVAKSTFAIQTAFNVVNQFAENAFVMHYDLEQALTYTRIKNITGASQKELDSKYILKQEKVFVEDIFDSIMAIAKEKEDNRNDYMYDTGLLDEFGEKLIAYVPTVVIIDSIPAMVSKDVPSEMEGGTAASRKAKVIAQFYHKLMPIIKTYNITIITINHINAKMEMNPFAKTQPQVMYLKMDEALPGGNAPMYYAHNLFKFVSSTKYKKADDGFDGFLVRIEILKSRTNKAGQSCQLVYNQDTGYDSMMSLYNYADECGLIEGRNPKRYIKGYDDIKFDARNFREEINEKPGIREALMNASLKKLSKLLSSGKSSDDDIKLNDDGITDYAENVFSKLFNEDE